jgi:hypothetical protein
MIVMEINYQEEANRLHKENITLLGNMIEDDIQTKNQELKTNQRIQELTTIVNNLEFLSNQVAVNNTTIKLLSEIRNLLEEVKKK